MQNPLPLQNIAQGNDPILTVKISHNIFQVQDRLYEKYNTLLLWNYYISKTTSISLRGSDTLSTEFRQFANAEMWHW